MADMNSNDPKRTKDSQLFGDIESRLMQLNKKLDVLPHEADDKERLSKQAHHFVGTTKIDVLVGASRMVFTRAADNAADSVDAVAQLPERDLTALRNWLSHVRISMDRPVAEHAMPPNRAEMLLHFGLPKRDRECMIGDLEEEFRTIILPKYGPRVAARWYWWQAVRSVVAACGGRIRVWLSFGGLARAAGWIVEKFTL